MNAFARLLLLVLAAGSPLRADQLTLNNGDSLSGSVREIGSGGRIVFESPNAAAPLQIRSSVLSTLEFSAEPDDTSPQGERVHLRNGDVLPGEILALDPEFLELRTLACGELRIPRSAISSADFGIAPHDLVFQGPGGPSGWSDNENWHFEDHALTASSTGIIARRDVLPRQFILRFRLQWETNPNFKFYFCDDFLARNGDADRYYFEVNSGGMQLKRQAADTERRWFPLYSSQRRPEEFENNSMEVELRVDRERRLLYVYIDGKEEACSPDPIANVPEGSGIMLESSAGGDMKNIVSAIEIFNWDAVSQLHRSEGHRNVEADAVVTNESERYEGSAQRLLGTGRDRAIVVKSPHSDEPVQIPFSDVSVLYFRNAPAEAPPASPFLLHLTAQGRLSIDNPVLSEDALLADHPLLGSISIRRDALQSLKAAAQPDELEVAQP